MTTIENFRNVKLRETLAAVKAEVRRIAGDEARTIVYGSYARGEEREDSDVDIMVVLPEEKSDFQTEERVRDCVIDIGLEDDFLISVMVVSKSQLERFKGFKVFDGVEKEGVAL